MPSWTIIADDLTGACDTGVAFARRGWQTRVAFSPLADFDSASVRVLTTESRALSAGEAANVVERAALTLRLDPSSRVYKKIDSTLRGHPGAELAALMRVMRVKSVLVTPAFPAQGRQVRDGQVWVHGVPLAESAFARDVQEPDMRRIFRRAGDCHRLLLDDLRGDICRIAEVLQRPGICIADAETDADLALLAQAAYSAGTYLLCGSAGLARAVADGMPAGRNPVRYDQQTRPVLVIAGSRSPVTLRQVEAAGRAGLRVVPPSPDDLRVAMNAAGAKIEAGGNNSPIIAQAAGCLSSGKDVIVTVAETVVRPGREAQIAAGLSMLTAAILASGPVGGLVLTGGETAAAVFRAIGCSSFDLGGEVLPGVVWGYLADGMYTGLPVVTKAGGFGNENALLDIIRFLRSLEGK